MPTLAVHELVANALEPGARTGADICVCVRWTTFDRHHFRRLALEWTEEGRSTRGGAAPTAPHRRGFGTGLIEARIPHELNFAGARQRGSALAL